MRPESLMQQPEASPSYALPFNRPVWLQSRILQLPGVIHGFATRLGGVSRGTCASLNYGLKGGDRPENVRENLERLACGLGFSASRFYRARQVHGREVLAITVDSAPAAISQTPADGLVAAQAGLAVGVLTADCVPVLLCDPERQAVAAVHAGWRGIVGGVLPAAVEQLCSHHGCRPAALRAALGPSIGPCCYEVGPEVAAQFAEFPAAIAQTAGGRPHLDLRHAARRALQQAGLPAEQIEAPSVCTRCQADLFFSYRRDGAETGHHLSVIALEG